VSVSVQSILEYLTSLNPSGRLGGEEGVLYGERDRDTDKVLVTWMVTVAAIEHAVSEECDVMVSHETLTFHDYFPNASSPDPWTADRARLSLLDVHGTTVIRAHSTVDPTHVVPAFIEAACLSPPLERGHVWSFHHEDPIDLRALTRKVADGLGMEGPLRHTGDPDRVVTRVGTMVGGLMQDRHQVLGDLPDGTRCGGDHRRGNERFRSAVRGRQWNRIDRDVPFGFGGTRVEEPGQ